MARLKRRSGLAKPGITGLSSKQRSILTTGFDQLGSGPGFESWEEYAAAWWEHRVELLASNYAFCRPEAYWLVEIGIEPMPGSPASKYASERDALFDLGLPISPEERAAAAKKDDGVYF